MARVGRFAGEGVGDVVAVEMHFEGLVAHLHALEQLLLHVRVAGGGQERGQHVFVGEDVVVDGAGLDNAGPTDGAGHTVAAFPVFVLLAAEGRGAAVGPAKLLRAVVGGIHDDGVVLEAEFFELVEELADHAVVFDHAVGVGAEAGLACILLLEVGEDMHAGGVPPEEEGLVGLLRFFQIVERSLREFLVNRLHALDVERPGEFDFLRAVRICKRVDHTPRAVFLPQRRIFEVVHILRLLLRVEVVERAHELVEAVRGGQSLVGVAEVVLAELRGHVALRLEQLGDGHITRLESFLRARQANLEQAGAEAGLPGDEARASGRAALLAIPVGEERALLRDPVNVGRLVAHHALVVRADVPIADVIAPDDEDVGFLHLCPCVRHGERDDSERQRGSPEAPRPATE